MALREMNPRPTVMEMPGSIWGWRIGNAAIGLGLGLIAAPMIWQAALPILVRGSLAILVSFGFLRYTSRRIIRLRFTAQELQLLLTIGRRHYQVEALELFEVFPSYANSMARVKIRKMANAGQSTSGFRVSTRTSARLQKRWRLCRKAGFERGLTPTTPHYELLDTLYRPVRRSRPLGHDSNDAPWLLLHPMATRAAKAGFDAPNHKR